MAAGVGVTGAVWCEQAQGRGAAAAERRDRRLEQDHPVPFTLPPLCNRTRVSFLALPSAGPSSIPFSPLSSCLASSTPSPWPLPLCLLLCQFSLTRSAPVCVVLRSGALQCGVGLEAECARVVSPAAAAGLQLSFLTLLLLFDAGACRIML
eukprot:146777-Rhodomonas_salina.1